MTTKRQRRAEALQGRKKKKSTRIIYLLAILGSIFIILLIFFVILFSALFPAVDKESIKNKEKYAITIYFSDKQERFLVPETRYIFKEADAALQAKEIVKALLDGSKTGLINTYPDGVTVKEVRVNNDGTAFINFDANLSMLHPGGSTAEMASIYSLVNSLTENVGSIKQVKILVEGNELPSIKGHISTKNVFRRDPGLIIKTQEDKS